MIPATNFGRAGCCSRTGHLLAASAGLIEREAELGAASVLRQNLVQILDRLQVKRRGRQLKGVNQSTMSNGIQMESLQPAARQARGLVTILNTKKTKKEKTCLKSLTHSGNAEKTVEAPAGKCPTFMKWECPRIRFSCRGL